MLKDRYVRFGVALEELEEAPGWEGFRLLDVCIRRAWPDYRGVELTDLEEPPGQFWARFTFRVW